MLDLVVAYKFIDAVLWYRNLGGAEEIKFGPPQVCKSKVRKHACGVVCGDFNDDGRVDVAARRAAHVCTRRCGNQTNASLFVDGVVARDSNSLVVIPHRSSSTGETHELGSPTTSHGGFRRVDAPLYHLKPERGASAGCLRPRRNASTFSVAYAMRHSSVSFNVTLPRSANTVMTYSRALDGA